MKTLIHIRWRIFLGTVMGACLLMETPAQDDRDLPMQQMVQGLVISDLSLPTPSEMFDAIAKQTNPRWRTHYRPQLAHNLSDRKRAAIWLGARVAEVFLAVEARDTQHVRNLSTDIKSYSTILGIGEKIGPRLIRLDAFAESQAWPGTRYEVEVLEGEISKFLEAQRDADIADLVVVGTWLRTLEVSTSVVRESDFEDVAICIGGAGLIDRLVARLERLGKSMQEDRNVDFAKRQLLKVARMWHPNKVKQGRVFNDADVADTHRRVKSILDIITKK